MFEYNISPLLNPSISKHKIKTLLLEQLRHFSLLLQFFLIITHVLQVLYLLYQVSYQESLQYQKYHKKMSQFLVVSSGSVIT